MQLAQLYFQQEHVEEGLNEVRAALRAEPDFPLALTTLAFYWISSGHEKEATEVMAKVRAQPRINAADQQRLGDAFVQRFGHAL
jgi:Tfp pilus assembly protein PilF